MTRRLWEISDDLAALEMLLIEAGGEIDEVTEPLIEGWFSELKTERDKKLDNYAGLIREIEGRAAERKAEAKRLAERAKIDENAASKLKDRLRQAFTVNGWKSVETLHFKLTLATAGGKQSLSLKLPAEQIPEEFRRVETVTSYDQDQIRAVLENGTELDFAELLPRSSYLKIS